MLLLPVFQLISYLVIHIGFKVFTIVAVRYSIGLNKLVMVSSSLGTDTFHIGLLAKVHLQILILVECRRYPTIPPRNSLRGRVMWIAGGICHLHDFETI